MLARSHAKLILSNGPWKGDFSGRSTKVEGSTMVAGVVGRCRKVPQGVVRFLRGRTTKNHHKIDQHVSKFKVWPIQHTQKYHFRAIPTIDSDQNLVRLTLLDPPPSMTDPKMKTFKDGLLTQLLGRPGSLTLLGSPLSLIVRKRKPSTMKPTFAIVNPASARIGATPLEGPWQIAAANNNRIRKPHIPARPQCVRCTKMYRKVS